MRAPGKLWFGNDNELSITNNFSSWMRINVADIDTTVHGHIPVPVGPPRPLGDLPATGRNGGRLCSRRR